ncbi:MAG TPA: threonylcarbamoyl-AMP synthase [Candidatus Faecousia faecigallinarum]|nr:threonylcarbamoyl-AMP synthase [Candidatus Faecousia faecigallinarum]
MNTLRLSAQDPRTPEIAAGILRRGGLVAVPTETVYGLGADGLNPAAVKRIFLAKGRPGDNPLILHVTGVEQLPQFCHDIPQAAYRLAQAFWPGPLTMVLPANDCVPRETTGGLDTVAIRCPQTPVTREIIRLAGVPVAAPSANLSGKPSTTTAQHVLHDHDGRIDAVVDGGPCAVGVESTIVDLTEDRPRLLRPGGVGPEALLAVLGDLVIDRAVTGLLADGDVVKAPGMKYRHYAPQEPVIIVAGSREKAARYIHAHFQPGDRVLCFAEELPLYAGCAPLAYGLEADPLSLSAGLFAALRDLDDPAVRRVFARCPVGGGVAYAVQNRLNKAAGFHIVDAEAAE